MSSCLPYVLSESGNKVPRPFSTSIHAAKPNKVIHFDYLFPVDNDRDQKYVSEVKDDLSGYFWLVPSPVANSEHTAEVLARWNRGFTSPSIWVSDQGSQFKNGLLKYFASTYRIRHSLTVAYFPWVNGTIESLMRSILSVLRGVLAEAGIGPQDLVSVLPAIASALIYARLERLGRNSK